MTTETTCWKCHRPIVLDGEVWRLAQGVNPEDNPCYQHDPNWICSDWFLTEDNRDEVIASMERCRAEAAAGP